MLNLGAVFKPQVYRAHCKADSRNVLTQQQYSALKELNLDFMGFTGLKG